MGFDAQFPKTAATGIGFPANRGFCPQFAVQPSAPAVQRTGIVGGASASSYILNEFAVRDDTTFVASAALSFNPARDAVRDKAAHAYCKARN
ncbi:MAG: hypothetical protein KDJ76_10335 [Xanthobacteraceae bacterium]|nr:hypothetical protein [Xanthobacteraceae bacterium]